MLHFELARGAHAHSNVNAKLRSATGMHGSDLSDSDTRLRGVLTPCRSKSHPCSGIPFSARLRVGLATALRAPPRSVASAGPTPICARCRAAHFLKQKRPSSRIKQCLDCPALKYDRGHCKTRRRARCRDEAATPGIAVLQPGAAPLLLTATPTWCRPSGTYKRVLEYLSRYEIR